MIDETTTNVNPTPQETTSSGTETDRRAVLKGAAAVGGLMAGFTGPTYLRDFNFTQSARAQGELAAAFHPELPYTLGHENAGWVHDTEGPDDMPAHVKAMLTGISLHVPVAAGRLIWSCWAS